MDRRLLVAQNTFARRVALDPKGHWNIKDQFNSGRNNAQILGAAAVDTDGDGSKEIVLFDRTSKSLLFLAQKDGVYRPSGTLLVGAINFQGMSVADFDGDGRDDLLIAGSDRFAVFQTGLKGLRLKMIAGFEPRRNEARLADLAVGDVNGDGCPDVVFSDIGEQSLEIATYAGDKDLIPAITFRIFERKIFHNAGDTIEPQYGHRRRRWRRSLRYRPDCSRPCLGLSTGPRPVVGEARRKTACGLAFGALNAPEPERALIESLAGIHPFDPWNFTQVGTATSPMIALRSPVSTIPFGASALILTDPTRQAIPCGVESPARATNRTQWLSGNPRTESQEGCHGWPEALMVRIGSSMSSLR